MSKYVALASALALAAAGLAAPTHASAQTFTPTFPGDVSFTGTLTFTESTALHCEITLNGVVHITGSSIAITSGVFAPGDWQCGWLVQPVAFPWTVTPTSPTSPSTVYISGMAFITILGACSGTATAHWRNAGSWSGTTLEFWGATIPGAPVNCSLVGDLAVSGGVTLH